MGAAGSDDELTTIAAGDADLTTLGDQGDVTRLNNAGDLPTVAVPPGATTLGVQVGVRAGASGPETIGRYRIVRLIGEGGMGAVYEAEQDQPRRTVALKVIKAGLTHPEILRRFAQESQALGRLQHPGIAQIFDAGAADTGFGPQPYFAMELIRGESLSEYAKTRRLTARQRLELMARVCDAVHHAHQRGLIHRDLKPGNILVDESGQPKILDFGVARITDSDAQATMQTDVGQLVGTLAYMSPEQVIADPLEIDTRSDVYALGVILYELLAGRLPYDISRKLPEALLTIREQDASRLSMIDRAFRGDVETIVAKALEKEKTRRYASAAELAADIRRFLTDEPIVAQPPTVSYQLRKFARRHKALVGGIAAVFVVLIAGVAVSTWQAVRASRAEAAALRDRDRAAASERTATAARDEAVSSQRQAVAAEGVAKQERDRAVAEKERADTESATAKAVSEFLQRNLFEQVTGGAARGAAAPDLTVRGALDRAAANVDDRFANEPLVEAGVREAIARAYIGLSVFEPAFTQLERALSLRRRVQGPDDPDVLKAEETLASAFAGERRFPQAQALLDRIVAVSARTRGPDDLDTLRYRLTLAAYYLLDAKYDKAAPHALAAARGNERVKGPSHRDTITALTIVAASHEFLKNFPQAIRYSTQAYERAQRAYGADDAATLNANGRLQSARLAAAAATSPLDRAARAEFFDTATRTLDTVKASSLPEMIALAGRRVDIAVGAGRPQDAEAPLIEALDAAARAGQQEWTLTALLVGVYAMQKKYTEAETTGARLFASPEAWKTLTPNVRAFALRGLGSSYRNDGRFAEAERHFRTLVSLELDNPGEAVQQTRVDILVLADTYSSLGRYADAEQWFTRLLEANRRVKGNEPLTLLAITSLGWVRLQQQRYADAERTLQEAADLHTASGAESWERFNVLSMLGATLAGRQRFDEAEKLLVSGFEGMAAAKPPSNPNFRSRFTQREAGAAILQLYEASGNAAKRAEWVGRLEPR